MTPIGSAIILALIAALGRGAFALLANVFRPPRRPLLVAPPERVGRHRVQIGA